MGVYKLSVNSVKNGRTIYGSMLAGNTAYVELGDFQSIATVTVGAGGAGTVTFSSIPSTYTHLHLRILARTTSNTANDSNAIETRFNGDSANNYSAHWAYGNGSTATVASGLTMSSTFLGFANSSNYSVANFCGNIIDILDYTSTSKNKTIRVFGGNNGGAGNYQFTSGMWRNNTTAISSISMTAGAGVFAQNSHFALYGIKGV